LAQYRKVRQFVEWVGLGLMVLMVGACSLIIGNFMGMRHQSRTQEINVVRLLGAHRGFVLTPFLWEGLIEGLLGAALSLVLLYGATIALSNLISIQWSSLLGIK